MKAQVGAAPYYRTQQKNIIIETQRKIGGQRMQAQMAGQNLAKGLRPGSDSLYLDSARLEYMLASSPKIRRDTEPDSPLAQVQGNGDFAGTMTSFLASNMVK